MLGTAPSGSVQLQDYCVRPVWGPGTVSLMGFTAKGDAPVPSYAQGFPHCHARRNLVLNNRMANADTLKGAGIKSTRRWGTATLMGRSYRGRRDRLPLLPWLECRIPQYRSIYQRAKLMPPRSRRNGTSVAGMAVLFFILFSVSRYTSLGIYAKKATEIP